MSARVCAAWSVESRGECGDARDDAHSCSDSYGGTHALIRTRANTRLFLLLQYLDTALTASAHTQNFILAPVLTLALARTRLGRRLLDGTKAPATAFVRA